VKAVEIMPKTKGKIPRITFPAVQPIDLSDENWKTIEEAYRHPIPQEIRTKIEIVAAQFLQLAIAEDTGLMEAAVERVTRLGDCARSLIKAIDARPVSDVTRNYVDDELGLSYARLNSAKFCKVLRIRAVPLADRKAARKYVGEIATDLGRFVQACDPTLKVFENAAQYDYWQSGRAWDGWIRQLTTTLTSHNLPTGVRKDVDKRSDDTPSAFTNFVWSLQKFLLRQHVRAHSPGALATAIHEARNQSKPSIGLRKSRARKSGANKNAPQR
jgi:hypothetical protein